MSASDLSRVSPPPQSRRFSFLASRRFSINKNDQRRGSLPSQRRGSIPSQRRGSLHEHRRNSTHNEPGDNDPRQRLDLRRLSHSHADRGEEEHPDQPRRGSIAADLEDRRRSMDHGRKSSFALSGERKGSIKGSNARKGSIGAMGMNARKGSIGEWGPEDSSGLPPSAAQLKEAARLAFEGSQTVHGRERLQAVVADAQATVLSNGVADNSILAAAGQSKFYQLLLSRNVCTCRLNACLLPQCPNTWALMGQPYGPNARRRPCPTCGSCSRASAETLTCMCR